MTCEFNNLLPRYHDGELPSAQRREFESHLSACAPCAAELEQLESMSRVLRAVKMPGASAQFLNRLDALASRVEETKILRFAIRLTAAAAAVLVLAMGYWSVHRPEAAQPAPQTVGWLPQEQVVVDPASAVAIVTDDNAAEPRLDDLIIGDLSKGRP